MNNNTVLKKLRIAFSLKTDDIRGDYERAEIPGVGAGDHRHDALA